MKHSGPAPFGFSWQDGRLKVVEKEAQIRRLAFELYVQLRSKAAVAQQLNAAGHQTRRGGKWRDVTVGRLLVCSSARGLYVRNRSGAESDVQKVEKSEDERLFVECSAIVSSELWERVHAILTNEGSSHSPVRLSSHPFTGVLFCQCGGRMNQASTELKFVCSKCGDRIPVQDLEARFLDELTTFVRARQNLAAEFVVVDQSIAEQRALLREAEQKTQQLEEDISKMARLYMDSRISRDRFEKTHGPLEKERRAMEREVGRIKAKLSRLEVKDDGQSHPSLDLNSLRQHWPKMLLGARREIVRTFVRQIVVSKDEIEFTYPFRDSSERTTKAQHLLIPTSSRTGGEIDGNEPVYIRLPKQGHLCSRTGMTRSALNELILPNERNGYKPPVQSKSLRKHDDGKGTRLIVWQSLKDYLASRG